MKFRFSSLIFCTLLTACSPGETQMRDALNDVAPPTLNGAQAWSISVRNLNDPVVVAGNCDQRASGMEFSLDSQNWAPVSSLSGADGDCTDGRFQFTLSSFFAGFPANAAARKTLQVRHVFRNVRGAPALVTVNYSLSLQRAAKGLRVVVGNLEGGTAATRVKLRIYARGKVQ